MKVSVDYAEIIQEVFGNVPKISKNEVVEKIKSPKNLIQIYTPDLNHI